MKRVRRVRHLREAVAGFMSSLKDKRQNNKIWEKLNWWHVTNAVKQELTRFIGSSMESSIEALNDDDVSKPFHINDLGLENMEALIVELEKSVKLSTKEVNLIQKIVQRAREYRSFGEMRS